VSEGDPTRRHRTVLATTSFVVFVCLALVAMNAWLVMTARSAEFRQASVATANLTRAVAQRSSSMFSEVGHALENISYELERSDITPELLQQLQPVLVNQVTQIEHLHGLFIFDAAGRWSAYSEPTANKAANNSDREYFIYHRDNTSKQWRIGKPIVSRSTNVWIVPVSRRIDDADGQFAGVILATVELDYLLRLLRAFDVGGRGAIALLQGDGTVMVRTPFRQEEIGKSIAGSPLYDSMRSSRSGTIESRSPLDGVQRLVSFQYLDTQPLVVAVAVAEDELLQDWRTASYLQTGWMLALCVLIAGAGSRVISLVRLRGAVEERLQTAHGELQRANAQLAILARHDGLTGLNNRRYFDQEFDTAFKQASRHDRALSIVMIDVDFFKRFNDLYGHPEGDRCLQMIAQALQSASRRPGDFVARYGGEEMVVLLPETDLAGARVVAESMRRAVLELDIPHEGNPAGLVTISAGIATREPGYPVRCADDLLKSADTALYRAKEEGRNRVCIHRGAAVMAVDAPLA
jgi:diguanylate cyclase (GGDEF)-like protein